MNKAYNSSNAYKYYDSYYMGQPQRKADYNTQREMPHYNDDRYSKRAEIERVKKLKRIQAQERNKTAGRVFRGISLFIIVGIFLYRGVLINQLNYTANNLKDEYNAIVEENQIIQNKIDSATDLKKLQEIATTELGMVRPSSDQIVYIENDKENYGEKVDKKENNKSEYIAENDTSLNGVLGSIVRFVTGK